MLRAANLLVVVEARLYHRLLRDGLHHELTVGQVALMPRVPVFLSQVLSHFIIWFLVDAKQLLALNSVLKRVLLRDILTTVGVLFEFGTRGALDLRELVERRLDIVFFDDLVQFVLVGIRNWLN